MTTKTFDNFDKKEFDDNKFDKNKMKKLLENIYYEIKK